jgi:hypothetical protein
MHRRTRGKELSGNFNSTLLTELYHQECKRWRSIATTHLEQVYDIVLEFNKKLLHHLNIEEIVEAEIQERIAVNLKEAMDLARAELRELWQDELKQPITYNHYYTDNIRKARASDTKKLMERALPNRKEGLGDISVATLMAAISEQDNATDMDDQACTEAIASLNAYYKVARKTWVDCVCRQVIERRLLRNLSSIFSPQEVAGYSDEDLNTIAGEGQDVVEKRKQLTEELAVLQGGLSDLRK